MQWLNIDTRFKKQKVFVKMVLIGTWIVVGFFSAVGWGVAQKTVVEPYINPAFDKAVVQPANTNDTNNDNK